jgi:hypothetical protein
MFATGTSLESYYTSPTKYSPNSACMKKTATKISHSLNRIHDIVQPVQLSLVQDTLAL